MGKKQSVHGTLPSERGTLQFSVRRIRREKKNHLYAGFPDTTIRLLQSCRHLETIQDGAYWIDYYSISWIDASFAKTADYLRQHDIDVTPIGKLRYGLGNDRCIGMGAGKEVRRNHAKMRYRELEQSGIIKERDFLASIYGADWTKWENVVPYSRIVALVELTREKIGDESLPRNWRNNAEFWSEKRAEIARELGKQNSILIAHKAYWTNAIGEATDMIARKEPNAKEQYLIAHAMLAKIDRAEHPNKDYRIVPLSESERTVKAWHTSMQTITDSNGHVLVVSHNREKPIVSGPHVPVWEPRLGETLIGYNRVCPYPIASSPVLRDDLSGAKWEGLAHTDFIPDIACYI